jgi:RNA polymerase sigma-70 factor (ECF subfamily)
MADVHVLLRKLRRLLKSRGRSPDDIDDLMQEAFLRLQLYCRDHVVHNQEAFLVTTALNLSAEQGRRASRAKVSTAEDDLINVMDPAPNADEILAGQQRLRRLMLGLQRLPPRSREVFLLNRSEGLSYIQIAAQLGISVSMVEKHVARAAFFLRDWMARSGL